jgi:hypothetical protein
MEPIDAALAAIELRKLGEQFLYQAVANQFGVNRTTLSQRHQGRQGSQSNGGTAQQKLNKH